MDFTKNEVLQYVHENDVKFIKLFFTDIFGNIKSVAVQPSVLDLAFEEGIPFDASAVSGFLNSARSDLFIVPDPTTLQVLPWRPQHGRVARLYCNICYPDGTPFEGDSRHILQQEVSKFTELGYDIKVGNDCEFYLYKLDVNGFPSNIFHDHAGYLDLAPLDKGENVRRDIVLNLEKMGIEPKTSHHEAGPGQNKIYFNENSALAAADDFSTFKMTVKTIAYQDGLFATFMPKPSLTEPGSGLHLNFSLFKNGKSVFTKDSKDGNAFIAGILNRICEITAFLNPMNQSYKRWGAFEAPSYVSWSTQNLSQLIRVCGEPNDTIKVKLRSPDPSCNHYLSLALIIAAGLEGIKNGMELPPAVDVDMQTLSKEQLLKFQKLPHTLDDALELAGKSDFVKSIVPANTLDAYIKAKKNSHDPEFGQI